MFACTVLTLTFTTPAAVSLLYAWWFSYPLLILHLATVHVALKCFCSSWWLPTRAMQVGPIMWLVFVALATTFFTDPLYQQCYSCCNWYHWGDGLGKSLCFPVAYHLTHWQHLLSTGACLPASMAILPVVGHAESSDHCCHIKWTMMRVSCKCLRQMCRKHCCTAGSCSAEGHGASSPSIPSLSDVLSLTSSSASSSLSSLLNIDPALHPPLPVSPLTTLCSASSISSATSSLIPLYIYFLVVICFWAWEIAYAISLHCCGWCISQSSIHLTTISDLCWLSHRCSWEGGTEALASPRWSARQEKNKPECPHVQLRKLRLHYPMQSIYSL